PLAGAAQILERAAAAVTEAKIVTDDDVPGAEALDEEPLDELPRRQPPELTKARAEELVDAGRVEQLEALPETRKPCRRIVRREHLAGRRLERAHEGRPPGRPSVVLEPGEDFLMAEVQPVERADRDRAPSLGRRQRLDVPAKREAHPSARPLPASAPALGSAPRARSETPLATHAAA